MDEVAERLDAIEARQREYEMHDPHCLKRATERNQRQTTMYIVPGPCTCWLSDTEWAKCTHCGGNIFSHDDDDGGRVWSHEGGTPPQDHIAEPEARPLDEVERHVRLLEQAHTNVVGQFQFIEAEHERLREAIGSALLSLRVGHDGEARDILAAALSGKGV